MLTSVSLSSDESINRFRFSLARRLKGSFFLELISESESELDPPSSPFTLSEPLLLFEPVGYNKRHRTINGYSA